MPENKETKKEKKVEDKVVEQTVVTESVNTKPVVEETKEEKFDVKTYRDTLTEKLDAIIATAKAQYEKPIWLLKVKRWIMRAGSYCKQR